MLILIINSDEYKLHPGKEQVLKRELLARYKDSDEVILMDGPKELDRLQLGDLFSTLNDTK